MRSSSFDIKQTIFFLTFLSFTLLSCVSVFEPVTRDRLDDKQLRMVQYYVSSAITLTRVIQAGERATVSYGIVNLADENRREQRRISSSFLTKTPGVLVGVLNSYDKEWLLISFEDDDNLFLPFFRHNHRFVLASHIADWPNTQYGGAIYRISYFGEQTPYLLARTRYTFRETSSINRVRGRRVN